MQAKKRKIIIAMLAAILVVLIIALAILVGQEAKRKQEQDRISELKQKVAEYTDARQFNSIEEVLVYLDSEFISQEEVKNQDKEYILIKAKLKNGLDIENKAYYEKLIDYSAEVLKYKDFYILDSEKNIEIYVQCNEEKSISTYYINGTKFYFDINKSNENIKQHEETKITRINNINTILEELIEQSWKTANMQLETKDSIFNNYDIYFDEGYEIKKVNGSVFNIVFTEKYNENVVENISINTSREDIIKQLGEPTFEYSECIGYKSKDFYIFFSNSKSQISIYPVINNYNTDEIVSIIEENKGSNDIGKYLNNIKTKWQDYDIYKVGEDYTILQYTLKGICFKYDNTSTQGVNVYSNYIGKVNTEKTLEEIIQNEEQMPEGMYFTNQDLVFMNEQDRISKLPDYSANNNYKQKTILNTSKKYKAYKNYETDQIYFISINKNSANSELREDIYMGIWYEDNEFIYSIQGKGIYKYNANTHTYSTITEGRDNFEIKKIESNKLYYDEKVIEL